MKSDLFRVRLIEPILRWSVAAFIGAVTLMLARRGNFNEWPDAMFVSLIVMCLTAAGAAFLGWIEVSEHGIRCLTLYGYIGFAEWSSIYRVRPTSFFGLRTLIVDYRGGWSGLWLPLYLTDVRGFVLSVRKNAGEYNPLTVALDTWKTWYAV